jgi:adenine phosphoribosyltransferase
MNKEQNQIDSANIAYLKKNLRCIEDFPKQGINFRDVTTLFKNPKCIEIMDEELYELYKDKGITKVVGIESRGFVMGAVLARRLNAGLIMCRKPGKLPAETISQSFEKEYGTDTIEIHKDAIDENDVVLIHDDLLATGGTIKAAWELVKKFNPKKCYMNFIIEIRDEGLCGRENIGEGIEVTSLMVY